MAYQLGIDLGTTWTAAAVCRDGQERPEVLPLGGTSTAVASVAFLAADGGLVFGEAAQRRALTEPERVAREFKRRIGDDTPLVVGGEPILAAELSARFVGWVVAEAARREGGPAEAIALTHPAEWGEHRRAAFACALAAHGLDHVTFLTEPQAAAVGYASTERIEPGGVVGVYDLGGGTFDAAVVHKLADGGFALLGSAGIEQLGGVDFDDAVLDHVRTALGPTWPELDVSDAGVHAAVAGLRRECTAAKEALSADTEVQVPVMLPGCHTQVRLVRGEFEDMIRTSIGETVEALRRAVDSAGRTPADLDAVLLVGGSSRIPLVIQLVSAELGRSIAVDADPKTVVAAGAALTARGPLTPAAAVEPPPAARPGRPRVEIEFDERRAAPAPAPRRRRTLVAASLAVAALGLSATLATGVLPWPVAAVGDGVAQAETAVPGVPAAAVAVDPTTGAPAEPAAAGPGAVTADVQPVARSTPAGPNRAPGAVPTPARVVAPAPAPVPVPAPLPQPAPPAGEAVDPVAPGAGSDTTPPAGSDAGGGTGGSGVDPGAGGGDAGGGGVGGGNTGGGNTDGGASDPDPDPVTPPGGSEGEPPAPDPAPPVVLSAAPDPSGAPSAS